MNISYSSINADFSFLNCRNYMSSQDVVDFVAERLKDPVKRKKLSLICEEVFAEFQSCVHVLNEFLVMSTCSFFFLSYHVILLIDNSCCLYS